jgi:hypothetical protein
VNMYSYRNVYEHQPEEGEIIHDNLHRTWPVRDMAHV